MADPIKTSILKIIKTEIEGIIKEDSTSLFTKTLRNPSKPIDHDYFKSPMCFIFDEPEYKIRRNRIADIILPIQIEAWIKTDAKEEHDISDQADFIDAEIHKTLVNSAQIRLFARDIFPSETGGEKFFINEFMGGIVMKYTVKYVYEWADPYDIGRL